MDDITTSWNNNTKQIKKLNINEEYQLSTHEYKEHNEKCLFFPNLVKPIPSKLYFLEFCSQGIISLDNLKQESIYELDNDIKDFDFQSNFEFMNIISNDNLVNIININ